MTPSRLTQFRSAGLTFDVRDSGPLDGPVVVALHGFPQTSSSWDAVTPLLTDAGYRVLAPDQRGYSPGARPAAVSAYRTDALCADVLALADAAGAERFHLLGHDWGAVVGWVLAATRPDRVLTLTAVSVPHPTAMVEALAGTQALRSWYMAFFQLPAVPELLLRAGGGVGARALLRLAAHPDPAAATAVLADRRTATGALNWYRALRLAGRTSVPAVTVPTLYVWSDADAALGRRGAEGTARHVSGPYRFEVLHGISHWVPEERPVELAGLVLERLRS